MKKQAETPVCIQCYGNGHGHSVKITEIEKLFCSMAVHRHIPNGTLFLYFIGETFK